VTGSSNVEPVDPDVEVHPGVLTRGWDALAAVTVGGIAGSLARYEAGVRWHTKPGAFPWTTFWINVVGCAGIGVVLVLVSEVWPRRRLVQPLLATGFLGGFTTFSAYAVDSQRLFRTGHAGTAWANLFVTLGSALVAVTVSTVVTRRLVRDRT
jgi:CrcB protein